MAGCGRIRALGGQQTFFYFANSWGLTAWIRWADRIGKGIRTAQCDALAADSTTKEMRGLTLGFNRAMDEAGAVLGLLIPAVAVWMAQANSLELFRPAFQTIVLLILVPAFLAVLSPVLEAKDVAVASRRALAEGVNAQVLRCSGEGTKQA